MPLGTMPAVTVPVVTIPVVTMPVVTTSVVTMPLVTKSGADTDLVQLLHEFGDARLFPSIISAINSLRSGTWGRTVSAYSLYALSI